MKRRIIYILLLSLAGRSSLIAQVNQQASVNNLSHPGKIYAVIVGISKYESTGIPQLEFAHRDAQVFADYLKSKAGGSVPEENIRLLLNENATYAAIYDAMNWLLETCQKDDLVYFYFSGHGDVENSTIYKLGFLLSYNTPKTNYINNAVRIEDLNNIANTLSVKLSAKVILITDACHSGKLAGNENKGSFLAGEQLRMMKAKEIRIASCGPGELSAEDEKWGGGRGVFSYYLVNGLTGFADRNKDETVTVAEIKNYLDSSLSNDVLLHQKEEKQTPVIKGDENFKLASVNDASLASLKKQNASVVMVQSAILPSLTLLKPLPESPQAYLFKFLNRDPEEMIDFDRLNQFSKEEIPFAFIKMIRDKVRNDSVFIDNEKISLLEKTLRENKDALKRFDEKLVVMLSDRGQEIINLYLNGDAAELERRRYYNSVSNGYDVYPKMFSVALKLTAPENFLYKILQVKLHYFTGVTARLKTPLVENPQSLLDTAMAEQKKALDLEKNAAYIQNELGVLYNYKEEYAVAEKYYLRATQIAPAWVIPWSNLIGLYSNTKNYAKAIEAAEKAKQLQADFQGIYLNSGTVYEEQGNLLMAEELFRKAIKINTRHYAPFERLGFVYTNTTQYALADSFFYESEKRKKGFYFFRNPKLMQLPKPIIEVFPVTLCNFDSLDVGKDDILGHFAWAMIANENNEWQVAEREFKKVIALDNANPLAFHYLGKLLYYQKRWEEADIIFNFALKYHFDEQAFHRYYDSLAKRLPNTKSSDCILTKFRTSAYESIDDHYFLATLYEQWNHYSEAEKHYRTIIDSSREFIGGYYKLWMMLENIGRYKDAEDVLRSYIFYDKGVGERELYSFYKRMMNRFPDEADWYYKAGVFLYHFAEANGKFLFDKKTIEPDDTAETYITRDITRYLQVSAGVRIKFVLPGIAEAIVVADKIYHPWTEGIACLMKVDSLLTENDDALADINYKIGDLFTWQGLPERAAVHYKRAVDFKPADANTRIKLIERYSTIYYLKDALEQLDSLYQRKEINFSMQLLMAEYCIHSGRFADASKLLDEAKSIHPHKIKEITDLNGRLQFLSNHRKEAIAFYKDYLKDNPNDSPAMYTIAKLNAQLKNTDEAWKWLKLSVARGFNYYWVLKYDAAWNDYRKSQQWKTITGKIPEPEVIEYSTTQ